MALQKTPFTINFSQGLDTKADPKQIQVGRFLSLQNSVFTKAGLLSKRNGYGPLAALPDTTSTYVTTFGGNLTAIGNKLRAYSRGSESWVNKGTFQPVSLSTTPVVRSALNQTQADAVVASNGFVCTVYTEINNSTAAYKYVIQDSGTGQNIIAPAVIPVSSGTVTGSPRVFLLGGHFILVFTNVIAAVSHLQYVAISVNDPTNVGANTDLAAVYISAPTLSWDGVVYGTKFYFAYNTTAGGQQIKVASMTQGFVIAVATAYVGSIATMMSICADLTDPAIPIFYLSYFDLGGATCNILAFDQNLNTVMTPTLVGGTPFFRNLASTAQNGVCTLVAEVASTYAYDSTAPTNGLLSWTITKPATVTTGTVSAPVTRVLSVGLASKGFLISGVMYVLAAYDGATATTAAFQPTYFLLNLSGQVIARVAYQNGGGYLTKGLPGAQIVGSNIYITYLFKDLIQSVNKSQGLTNAAGIYSQTGVNLGAFTLGPTTLATAELGKNLNLSGGVLYAYDGNTLNEQNFNLYPDMDQVLDGSGTSKALAVSHTGGSMTTQNYFYVALYEWTDAQGNIIRSAPSIPVPANTASFTASSNSVVVSVPACRLTYKTGVKIIIYRWSTAQQSYFQVTSISAPTLNNTLANTITFTDTQTDAAIAGNSLLYTTGGVLENDGTSACTAITVFDTRLFAISAEDQNLLLYSKQVIENTPVEMSNNLSIYVAPNAGTSTNTGPMRCLAPMDDKLIIFKENALYYMNGSGPDNTGSNSQYSQPIFITSTVGSINQNSIVLIPDGLLFQSDKGIWLLKRDLQTTYKGAPVEAFNSYTVNSALNIPGTNQVRFTLSNGITLMYDYFYDQWGTFIGVPAISSTIYQGLHTYINSAGAVAQETPGLYRDNGNPVLMQFTTGWLNFAGLQGYQRAFEFFLLGEYFTPHKVVTSIAYDFNSAPEQMTIITPTNYSAPYGDDDPYGQGTPFGGPGTLEQWRVHLTKQRCQSLQISIQETFDASFGVPAGAGFTLSGLTIIAAMKRGWTTISAANSVGGNQ